MLAVVWLNVRVPLKSGVVATATSNFAASGSAFHRSTGLACTVAPSGLTMVGAGGAATAAVGATRARAMVETATASQEMYRRMSHFRTNCQRIEEQDSPRRTLPHPERREAVPKTKAPGRHTPCEYDGPAA